MQGNHYLTAVSEAGAVLWTSPLGAGRQWDFAGPAMSSDEKTIYIYRLTEYNEGILNAVSAETGEKVWELPLEWGGTGWQTFTSFAVANDGTIWLASYVKYGDDSCYGRAENLIGISPNGHIRRKFPLHGDMDCGSHISIGPSGTIYVTYDNVRQYWDGTRWFSWLEYNDGQPPWDWFVGPGWYSWDGGFIYVDEPPKKGGIAAYDTVKGFKWKFELPDSFEANAKPAIDAKENIYFAASFGERLYSLNRDGKVNWVFDIAPGVEPTHGSSSCGWFCAEDEFTYGVAPVIGLGGSIHVMGSKYLYTIEGGPTIQAVTAMVEGLVSQGALNTGDSNSLLSKLAQAENAATAQARANVLQATINQINALERSGRLTPAKAEEMRSILRQL